MMDGSGTRDGASRQLVLAAACALVVAMVSRCPEREHVRSPERTYVGTRAAVSVEPRTPEELALVVGGSLDVWSEHVATNEPVTVVLSRASIDALVARGVPHRILIDDIQAVADAERMRLEHRAKGATRSDWFAEYRAFDEISAYMELLAERHPALTNLRRIGTSVEGRPMRAIEISRGGKIGIVLDGGQHAREWISVMVPMCIADRLLNAQDRDPRVRRILDAVRFYVVPVVNPDGYVYSWQVERYWRKSRRGGYGVDLNRNYSVAWGQAGSSGDKRSPNYRGAHAFSEPETQAMRNLFASEPIRAHVDFHSFSQLILYPWSHQRAAPPDRDKFAAISDRMSTAIYAAHGARYRIRPGAELQVGAGGTLADWTYGEQGALSFVVELRPASGGGGFVLPPELIIPTCEENLAAVLELAEWMIRDAAEPMP